MLYADRGGGVFRAQRGANDYITNVVTLRVVIVGMSVDAKPSSVDLRTCNP
jgi:hypothetical protein